MGGGCIEREIDERKDEIEGEIENRREDDIDGGREDEKEAELQKRADRADQSVLFFLAGANFWEKHAKNCAIMSMAHITYAIAH